MGGNKGRGPVGKRVEQQQRKREALALRNAGAQYRDISRQMGVPLSTVHGWVQAEISDIPAEERTILRRTESERLDRLQRAVWDQALRGDLAAVREAVRIIDRRARLLGLDAPAQIEVGVGHVDIAQTAQRIIGELDVLEGDVVDDDEGDDDG